MGSERIMRMIDRMEILIDEAERVAMKYPNLLNRRGFLDRLFGNEEEDEARAKFQSLLYEVHGVALNIKEAFKRHGVSLKSEAIRKLVDETNEYSGREIINLMRTLIGFVRTKTYEL